MESPLRVSGRCFPVRSSSNQTRSAAIKVTSVPVRIFAGVDVNDRVGVSENWEEGCQHVFRSPWGRFVLFTVALKRDLLLTVAHAKFESDNFEPCRIRTNSKICGEDWLLTHSGVLTETCNVHGPLSVSSMECESKTEHVYNDTNDNVGIQEIGSTSVASWWVIIFGIPSFCFRWSSIYPCLCMALSNQHESMNYIRPQHQTLPHYTYDVAKRAEPVVTRKKFIFVSLNNRKDVWLAFSLEGKIKNLWIEAVVFS